MQDDFRPRPARREPARTRFTAPGPDIPAQSVDIHAVPEPEVDTKKIEEEFGPTPLGNSDGLTAPQRAKGKVMKLLPAFASHPHRKRLLMLIGIGLAILLIVGAGSYLILTRYNPATPHFNVIHNTPKPPKPKTVASNLTGLQVDPSVNERPVTAVMIENSLDARPQSGLDQADVVFEALAEGGVTRFMALYQDSQPDYIGPVRSARPYYIQWLLGFDAAYAHVGGSADALSDITAWHVKDLNQFYNANAYHRITSRYAPHNVYTSMAELNQLEATKGFTKSNYTGFVRKAKEDPSKTPTATSIDIKFSGYYYDSHYDYDPATNTYKRSESGEPHMELLKDGSKVQIAPKVVVAMVVPMNRGALDASGAYYSDYVAIGSGQITVFQDGIAQTGTWSKGSNTDQIKFLDANGQSLALNPGQTWIAATPLASNVTYK